MLLLIATSASAGKFDGWDGHPWGSTDGGPKDPAAAAWYPKQFGEDAYVVCNRPSSTTKFGDEVVLNPFVTYVEGRLAGATFVLKDPGLLEKMTVFDGTPFHGAMSSTLFQHEDVSLLVQPAGSDWLVNVVYLPLKKRCVELFGPACTVAETKTEAEADPHWHAQP